MFPFLIASTSSIFVRYLQEVGVTDVISVITSRPSLLGLKAEESLRKIVEWYDDDKPFLFFPFSFSSPFALPFMLTRDSFSPLLRLQFEGYSKEEIVDYLSRTV